jgi:uncharacterized Zn-finger protein
MAKYELTDNEVICPHCNNVVNYNGLIGENTNDCPCCGKVILTGEIEDEL